MKKDLFWKLSLIIVGLVLIDQFAKGVVQSLSEHNSFGTGDFPISLIIFHDKTFTSLVDHSYSSYVLILLTIIFIIIGRKTFSKFARKNVFNASCWALTMSAIFSKWLDLAMFGYEIKIVIIKNGHFGLSDFYLLLAILLFCLTMLSKPRLNPNATYTL